MSQQIINLCPHPLHIKGVDGEVTRIYNFEKAARLQMRQVTVSGVGEAKVRILEAGRTINLPPPRSDTFYAVSKIVAVANPHRRDLLVPDTEEATRSMGRIVSTPGFISLVQSDYVAEFQSIADEMITMISSGHKVGINEYREVAGRLQTAVDNMSNKHTLKEESNYEDL